jgi:hypothetical protein
METNPIFLQGVYSFEGKGLAKSFPLDSQLTYTVPGDKRSQLIYLRAGNSSPELIALILMREGKPMRYFPVGARSDTHVPLAVVEDLEPDTKLEVFIVAPAGVAGAVVLDIGLLEI